MWRPTDGPSRGPAAHRRPSAAALPLPPPRRAPWRACQRGPSCRARALLGVQVRKNSEKCIGGLLAFNPSTMGVTQLLEGPAAAVRPLLTAMVRLRLRLRSPIKKKKFGRRLTPRSKRARERWRRRAR